MKDCCSNFSLRSLSSTFRKTWGPSDVRVFSSQERSSGEKTPLMPKHGSRIFPTFFFAKHAQQDAPALMPGTYEDLCTTSIVRYAYEAEGAQTRAYSVNYNR